MRVVIDTNVLVSGIINPHGAPGRVLESVLAKAVLVLHDDRILDEYQQVLRRPPFGFEQSDIDSLLDFIELNGEHVSTRDIGVILPDVTDLPFLEVAVLGHADALITGDLKHFKARKGRHSAYVCTPAEFVNNLPASGS
jgi:putative PIN family toxin of toxin-antitoxin system